MKFKQLYILVMIAGFLVSTSLALPPKDIDKNQSQNFSASIDNTTFIDANNIFMFVTNHGNFGRDLDGFFGYDYGTFYPFIDTQYIRTGYTGNLSPLYAAGLWLGGVNQNGDTLIAASEYRSEYVPGPMSGGTFQADQPEFKVYKLYRDSLESNPNADYLNWPVAQGAPVDSIGKPLMKGDQMLWTVFNDADPSARWGKGPGNTAPMGIEVQMSVWAYDSTGDFEYVLFQPIRSIHYGRDIPRTGRVTAYVVEPENVTGHDYMVVFEEIAPDKIVWHLIDTTTGDTLLFDQTNQSGDDNYPIVDGLQVKVVAPPLGLIAVEEIQNGSGVLDPPYDVDLKPNSTGDWYLKTAPDYPAYDIYYFNGPTKDEWEIRFTAIGSNYYHKTGSVLQPDRAPFEVWNIGQGTPDDPSDDIQINTFYLDRDGSSDWSYGDYLYFSERHYAEPPPNDPPLVWPDSASIGYLIFADSSHLTTEPAEGTIVRLSSLQEITNLPSDTFVFSTPTVTSVMTGGEGNAIYIEYKLYNKGSSNFDDFFTGYWADPDLGSAGDDFVGCDTLSSTFFCYNADNTDNRYGTPVPATGFRVLAGPLAQSDGDSALFGDNWIQDSRNLPMTAFFRLIGALDPENYQQSYLLFSGYLPWGSHPEKYTYAGQELNYELSGDPVTGQGDLDCCAADRRMIASSGPVTFNSGDSQYVLLKFAVGHGNNNLESITKLREILGVPDIVLDAPNGPTTLPDKYSLSANYPNPFNPSTTIEYNLPRKSQVTLAVFNILGRQVKTLVDQAESPGKHTATWNGQNEKGEAVASGIYFYRLRAEEFSQTRKMMLLK